MRVTITHKETVTQFILHAAVVSQWKGLTKLWHYHNYYLPTCLSNEKPYRELPTDEFHIIVAEGRTG